MMQCNLSTGAVQFHNEQEVYYGIRRCLNTKHEERHEMKINIENMPMKESNESTAAEVGEYIVYPFSNNISNLLICIVKHDVNEVDENEEEDIEIKSMSEENSKKN
ncbi:uncharacterized protein LOC142320926 [Lycorma delicatula]|uniref:uncharacterized protein LOC142320926 n=1 Tax=Lycorma delicatula TaxID=130591 RepID=UPI003F50F952